MNFQARKLVFLCPIEACTTFRTRGKEHLVKRLHARRLMDEELFDLHPVRKVMFFGTLAQLLAEIDHAEASFEAKQVINCLSQAGWNICYKALGYCCGKMRMAKHLKRPLRDDELAILVDAIWLPHLSEQSQMQGPAFL